MKEKQNKFAKRFINDELNLNAGGDFGRSFQDTYPPYFELKYEKQISHAEVFIFQIRN